MTRQGTGISKAFLASLLFGFLLASSFAGEPAIIVNKQNDEEIDQEQLTQILKGQQAYWGDGREIGIALLKNHPETELMIEQLTRMSSRRFLYHWRRLSYSGRGKAPLFFKDAASLMKYVSEHDNFIGVMPPPVDGELVKVASIRLESSRSAPIASEAQET